MAVLRQAFTRTKDMTIPSTLPSDNTTTAVIAATANACIATSPTRETKTHDNRVPIFVCPWRGDNYVTTGSDRGGSVRIEALHLVVIEESQPLHLVVVSSDNLSYVKLGKLACVRMLGKLGGLESLGKPHPVIVPVIGENDSLGKLGNLGHLLIIPSAQPIVRILDRMVKSTRRNADNRNSGVNYSAS